jgi:plasmid stabilization system protein ParE
VKRITYLRAAELDLTEAAEYYDQQQSGLGRDFLDAVARTEVFIRQNPEFSAFYEKPVRSHRVQPFSYRLLYREFPDRIQIVAVMHSSRRPDYWKNRIL